MGCGDRVPPLTQRRKEITEEHLRALLLPCSLKSTWNSSVSAKGSLLDHQKFVEVAYAWFLATVQLWFKDLFFSIKHLLENNNNKKVIISMCWVVLISFLIILYKVKKNHSFLGKSSFFPCRLVHIIQQPAILLPLPSLWKPLFYLEGDFYIQA